VSPQDYLPSPIRSLSREFIYGAFEPIRLDCAVPHRKNDISVSFGIQPLNLPPANNANNGK
jgi:hypothetical protein